jgi:cytochrome c-type biogenesis protein CcmF
MTRSGIVQSVHAFGQDTQLAWIFTIFMAFILIVSFGFVIKRIPELRARATFESWLSREAAFTVNNWILLLAAFFVLFATMFPTLSEAITGQRITVGPPFFNKWMVPIGLALLFLTGVGPLIAWRKATPGNLRYQFMYPASAAAITVGICMYAGLGRSWAAVVNFGFCALVFTTITQEFVRNLAIRRRNTGSDVLSAGIGMVLRNRRRYGGYLVHLGIVLMFLGFAGTAYQKELEAHLVPGQRLTIGKYMVEFQRLAHEEDRQKEMVTGELTASVDGQVIDHMRPARWYFHGHEGEPTTEVAMHRTAAEDLYITLGNYDLADGSAMVKVVINPLVDWIWFGFMLLAFGTGIALLPEAVLDRVLARAAQRAGGTSEAPGALVLAVAVGLAALLGSASVARAADDMLGLRGGEPPTPQGVEENWLVRNIICQCGSCRHNLLECASENCGHAAQDRIEIHGLLAEGKTREDVIQYFIQKYGSQIALASPIDKGFNRLAWGLPYGVGIGAAGLLAYGAFRMAKRSGGGEHAPAGAPGGSSGDLALRDQLDDELSHLD